MGTSFTALHVRSNDPADVWSAVDAAGVRELLIEEAAENGWVAVYPREHDARAEARAVSESCDTLVLYTMAYDSDLCVVVLFNRGKRVTAFETEWSEDPGKGRPGDETKFAKYSGAEPGTIRELLDTERVFAEEHAVEIARLFGIRRERVVCDWRYFRDAKADALGRVRGSDSAPWLKRVPQA